MIKVLLKVSDYLGEKPGRHQSQATVLSVEPIMVRIEGVMVKIKKPRTRKNANKIMVSIRIKKLKFWLPKEHLIPGHIWIQTLL